ncbi:DUF2156 domain-containing protein [Patescibacteria group bacterium]|nr:DUF2156 domain-containing protein [Patescibacteria group bacterium]
MNDNSKIEGLLSNLELEWFRLGRDFHLDFEFLTNLYSKEKKHIFEHSPYHVLSYLRFKNQLYGISGRFGSLVLVSRKDDKFLFTPRIDDFKSFELFIKAIKRSLGVTKIEIRNVSEQWLQSFLVNVSNVAKRGMSVKERSREEAIYDVDLLCELRGKDFAGIRQSRNKLLNSGSIQFKPFTKISLKDGVGVLNKWQKVQGWKYVKERIEKEKYVLARFFDFSRLTKNVLCGVGYYKEVPLSILVMHLVPNGEKSGTIYLLKGINRPSDGGTHGISDATYCYAFLRAKEMGIKYLNDGELGTEEGTRRHKLNFKPIEFLKSYDVLL